MAEFGSFDESAIMFTANWVKEGTHGPKMATVAY